MDFIKEEIGEKVDIDSIHGEETKR